MSDDEIRFISDRCVIVVHYLKINYNKSFCTGATGFVGSAVVKELISAGQEVLGLARNKAAEKALVLAGAEVHKGDLQRLQEGEKLADDISILALSMCCQMLPSNS